VLNDVRRTTAAPDTLPSLRYHSPSSVQLGSQIMIRKPIRVASAIAGALMLIVGLSAIAHDLRQGAALLIGSIVLFAPLCMPAIDASGANRLRIAVMICFTLAGVTWIAVMLMRNHDAANSIAPSASRGGWPVSR
jgi:hypothetical protein